MMLHVGERKDMYAFLHRLFSYPDRELVAVLAGGGAAKAAARVPGAGAPIPGSAELRELEVAYTELFLNRLGGVAAPPYGSVYLEPEALLMGETTQRVAAAYRAEGLSLEGSGEPADFLPNELEFLYYLVGEEEAALARPDLSAARTAVGRQRDFARTFLYSWVPTFCQRIEEDPAAHPLYHWGAGLLAAFCRQEEEWLAKMG
jgi:TorA maturation chaperone TorD